MEVLAAIINLHNDTACQYLKKSKEITVGYAHTMVGFLKYDVRKKVQKVAIISGSVGGCVLILTIIGAIFGWKKYRKVAERKKQLSDRLDNIEEEIEEVAKQRFKKKRK